MAEPRHTYATVKQTIFYPYVIPGLQDNDNHTTSPHEHGASQHDNVEEGGTTAGPEQVVDNSLKSQRQQTTTGAGQSKPLPKKQKQLLAAEFSASIKDRPAVTAPKERKIDEVIATLDQADIGGNDDISTLNVRSGHV